MYCSTNKRYVLALYIYFSSQLPSRVMFFKRSSIKFFDIFFPQGNFFQNLGSIVLFAVVGTAISTCVVGGGLYALSKLDVIFQLDLVQRCEYIYSVPSKSNKLPHVYIVIIVNNVSSLRRK